MWIQILYLKPCKFVDICFTYVGIHIHGCQHGHPYLIFADTDADAYRALWIILLPIHLVTLEFLPGCPAQQKRGVSRALQSCKAPQPGGQSLSTLDVMQE